MNRLEIIWSLYETVGRDRANLIYSFPDSTMSQFFTFRQNNSVIFKVWDCELDWNLLRNTFSIF